MAESKTDPKTLVERLNDSGMRDAQIAAALSKDGVEVTQATINRIKNGKHASTSFEIGMGLLRLAQSRIKSGKRASALSA
jgi:hypothetical protein